MRSRLLTTKDPALIDLSPYITPFPVDQAKLDRELARLASPYVRWEKGTTVSEGDMVVCRLVSESSRFIRDSVKFVAGSGMFHRDLEALALGMRVNETRETDLPEGHVTLTVTEVTNKIVPPLGDEMVKALGLENVDTLEDYRAYLLSQQKEEFQEEALYAPVQYLQERLLEESEFVIAKEDWRAAVERKLERCRILARQEGMALEEMTPQQFDGRIPVKSYPELVAMVQDKAWDNLQMYLLGRHYAQSDGFTVGEADYEAYIAEYVKNWGVSPEKAREIDPYESFVFHAYGNHAFDILWQYVKKLY